jgi:DNA-binding phage protein
VRKKKDTTSVSHDEVRRRRLRTNSRFAAEYLKVALEGTEEPAVLLIALRRIAEAIGGIAKVAKAAGIERESLLPGLVGAGEPSAVYAGGRDRGGGAEAYESEPRGGCHAIAAPCVSTTRALLPASERIG